MTDDSELDDAKKRIFDLEAANTVLKKLLQKAEEEAWQERVRRKVMVLAVPARVALLNDLEPLLKDITAMVRADLMDKPQIVAQQGWKGPKVPIDHSDACPCGYVLPELPGKCQKCGTEISVWRTIDNGTSFDLITPEGRPEARQTRTQERIIRKVP